MPDVPSDETVLLVLREIAAGASYQQIVTRHPTVRYRDIFASAQVALDRMTKASNGARVSDGSRSVEHESEPEFDRLPADAPRPSSVVARTQVGIESSSRNSQHELVKAVIRQYSPRSWDPWTDDEEALLAERYRSGIMIPEIAEIHGRQFSAIVARLVSLGLIASADLDASPRRAEPISPAVDPVSKDLDDDGVFAFLRVKQRRPLSPEIDTIPKRNVDTPRFIVSGPHSADETIARAGQPWSSSEEDRLVSLYEAGKTVADIAGVLQRKPGGIVSRLRRLGFIIP